MPNLSILPEIPDDWHEVEYLYDICFAPGRAALSSYQLRDGVDPVSELCLVMRNEAGAVVSAIRYWPVLIGDCWPALLLGPLATHPTAQGEGLGALLIRESLERAKVLDWHRVVLVGDAPYYSRFGFTRAFAKTLDYPPPTNPERLLARPLREGAFEGVSGMVGKWHGRGK